MKNFASHVSGSWAAQHQRWKITAKVSNLNYIGLQKTLMCDPMIVFPSYDTALFRAYVDKLLFVDCG